MVILASEFSGSKSVIFCPFLPPQTPHNWILYLLFLLLVETLLMEMFCLVKQDHCGKVGCGQKAKWLDCSNTEQLLWYTSPTPAEEKKICPDQAMHHLPGNYILFPGSDYWILGDDHFPSLLSDMSSRVKAWLPIPHVLAVISPHKGLRRVKFHVGHYMAFSEEALWPDGSNKPNLRADLSLCNKSISSSAYHLKLF